MIEINGKLMPLTQFTAICFGLTLILFIGLMICIWLDSLTTFTFLETIGINQTLKRLSTKRQNILLAQKRKQQSAVAASFFKKLKIFPMPDYKREEFDVLIDKLDVRGIDGEKRTVDEYYVSSCYIVTGIAVGSFLLSFIIKPAILGLVTIPYFYNFYFRKLYKRHMQDIVNIEAEMPKFISMFYFRFRDQTQDLRLDSLITAYLPLAGDSMRRMLMRLDTDLRNMNDLIALEKLGDRYPESNYVYSFCSVAQGIWKKQTNAYIQLHNLYEELKLRRQESFEDQLKEQAQKAQKAFQAIWVLFGIEILVFIIFQIAQV